MPFEIGAELLDRIKRRTFGLAKGRRLQCADAVGVEEAGHVFDDFHLPGIGVFEVKEGSTEAFHDRDILIDLMQRSKRIRIMSGNRPGPLTVLLTFVILAGGAAMAGGFAFFLALLVSVLILLYPLLLPLWKKLYGLPDTADQVFYARTEDGWYLALHYHEPRVPLKGALPVLLVHGIATNKSGVDLDEYHSVACYLKSRGFPVFAVSLRGAGLSHRKQRYARKERFTFDDHVRLDAPAMIRRVIELTGAPALNWVGYSMGGMIGNAFCGSDSSEVKYVQSLVTIGSPGKADHVKGLLMDRLVKHPWVKHILPLQPGSAVLAPLGGWIQTPIDRILYNPETVRRRTVQLMLQNAITEVNQGLLDEMARWVREGNESSNDGLIEYRRSYERIRCPTLMIAGAGDHIAPPIQVRFAFEKCGSRTKKFILAGKRQGYEHDYCHIGLVMGEDAPDEVFPQIVLWLEEHGVVRQSKVKTWVERIKQNLSLRKALKKPSRPIKRKTER
ncbi:MAG: alpha/beta hydrolase [Leptonema illini]|uniref:Alpha/beta hydrolase n=1 Tax=Leptonema illini TaxID=183 RepID=A0A833LZ89_9LEPT|nr:MAG: alpha/beta hydrolase [Leptonema illini]PKL31365.1 MAG: hydrolase [Spirochaetae bacterium HGW-Spirochaetae-10]